MDRQLVLPISATLTATAVDVALWFVTFRFDDGGTAQAAAALLTGFGATIAAVAALIGSVAVFTVARTNKSRAHELGADYHLAALKQQYASHNESEDLRTRGALERERLRLEYRKEQLALAREILQSTWTLSGDQITQLISQMGAPPVDDYYRSWPDAQISPVPLPLDDRPRIPAEPTASAPAHILGA